ncbi:MAG TPA: PQQ-dependent sugar dehydrogenase [Fodinibius sp.]|nr:PQQ-dependent sugar dehydrogenase [Fodinibius sp.]
MSLTKYSLIIISVILLAACSESATESPDFNFSGDNGGITLPDGFKSVIVADKIGSARHITVAENGDIYIALSELHNGHGIAALRDQDGDGKADSTRYFGSLTGTGIQLHEGYLYFASDTSVVRYAMEEGALLPEGKPETVVSGFPEQNQHASKPFTFDKTDHIYVTVGAPSNACQEESRTPESPGMDPCPLLEEHGGIWQFQAGQTGQQFEDGQRYATGIRNAVALDWDNQSNQLYIVQHGRDQLNTLWPEYYDAKTNALQPAEEMFAVNEGDNFGWPYVYYDWKKEQKMIAPEYGGDGQKTAEEGKFENPIVAFPGHWAPNDLLFYQGSSFPAKYQHGAFVAFHGSWNRAPKPQAGYKVAFVPFDDGAVNGEYEIFADNFAGSDSLQSAAEARYRPMGLAQGADGSLYIVDSKQGKLWRIIPNK